jgi:ParB-like chromosome segregation protein Spo0J
MMKKQLPLFPEKTEKKPETTNEIIPNNGSPTIPLNFPVKLPVLGVKLVPADKVVANDYNPNKVATPEFELLTRSIEADGVTQPIVTFYDADHDKYIVVDGFHRTKVLKDHFHCLEIPVVVIEKDIKDRMASTIRHNRARGKHQVDLMGVLVKKMITLGATDLEIARELGMEAEEILRFRQQQGIAEYYSQREYSRSWEWKDDPETPPSVEEENPEESPEEDGDSPP